MKSFLRIIFLLFLNFYVAALLQVSVSVWKVFFFPQRTETFFSSIFKWKKMFPAGRGISRREKKERKERELDRLPIAMRSIM